MELFETGQAGAKGTVSYGDDDWDVGETEPFSFPPGDPVRKAKGCILAVLLVECERSIAAPKRKL